MFKTFINGIIISTFPQLLYCLPLIITGHPRTDSCSSGQYTVLTAAILTGFTLLLLVTLGWNVRKVWGIYNLPQSDVVSTEKHGGCKEH
jgi:hypothetical protein